MTARKSLIAVGVVAALGACGTAQDLLEGNKVDYKTAGRLPPLEIPPDLTSPVRDNRYLVPDTGKGATTLSVYQAERSQRVKLGNTSVLPAVDNMRIERSGSQRWLVVAETPEKLWPLVKDFWQENGFLVKVDLPEAGVMETDWAENRAKIPGDFIRKSLGKLLDQAYSTPERDKFRTRMERGTDGKSTEVYISHRGMVEIFVEEGQTKTMWQPRPVDPGLEAEFLSRLMIRLGGQADKAKAITASNTVESRAQIKKSGDGSEMLEVFEPFDRAWRRVGLALDRVGFTVEDRDRQKGLYFVRYADPEAEMERKAREKPGLLSKLAFWRSSGKDKVKTEQYQVSILRGAENSQVRVLRKDGTAEATGTAHRILALLHEQLK